MDPEDEHSRQNMCDMACQTRESLFQPVFKNKIAQSPTQHPGSIRFSTFGYDSSEKSSKHSTNNKINKTVATTIEMDDFSAVNELNKIHQRQQKIEESRIVLDIRNSAPDVIIMTSH